MMTNTDKIAALALTGLGAALATCSAYGLQAAGIQPLAAWTFALILTGGASACSVLARRHRGRNLLYFAGMAICVSGAILSDSVYLAEQILQAQPDPAAHQAAAALAAEQAAALAATETELRAAWQAELATGDGPKAKALAAALETAAADLREARAAQAHATQAAAEAEAGQHAALRLAASVRPEAPQLALCHALIGIAAVAELVLLLLAWGLGVTADQRAAAAAPQPAPVAPAAAPRPAPAPATVVIERPLNPIARQTLRRETPALGTGLDRLFHCPPAERLN